MAPATASAQGAHADSMSAFAAADTAHEAPPPPEALAFAARLRANDLIRVRSELHRFQGHARHAGPGGLERLVADGRAPADWRSDHVPERIPWSAIDEVRMLRGNAGRGALLGAAVGGGLLAFFAASAASTFADPTSMGAGEAALRGALVGAPIGAVLGAGVGAAFRTWKVVYHRP